MEAYKGIWIIAEQRGAGLAEVSLELLGAGRMIADQAGEELAAVMLGHHIQPLVKQLWEYGADKVYLADNQLLENYRSDTYTPLIHSLIEQYKPSVVLIGSTCIGNDLAPRIAARANTGLSAHCTAFDINEDGQLVGQVAGFGGSLMAYIICPDRRPQMATARAGFFPKPRRQTARVAETIRVPVSLSEDNLRIKVSAISAVEAREAHPIESADIVVAGGYGIGSKEHWALIDELAQVLGGSVGATRPPCDEGWADLDIQMIGQSGKVVHPDLYIGVGISGAMHHLVGIKDSKVIIAINRDPKAPIFQAADYCLVGDFRQLIPCLIDEFKRAREDGFFATK